MRGQGDHYVRLILGNLIVPKVHPRIVAFVCDKAPDVFLERLHSLSWLRKEVGLVAGMVDRLSPSTQERNGSLLTLLAENGCMEQLERLATWDDTLTAENVDAAMEAASKAGHAEASAWLLAHHPRHLGTASAADASDDLFDLLL